MVFQTGMSISMAEVVYRAVRSAISATVTSTDRLATGEPVNLTTETASANGIFVSRPITSTNVLINNLYVGNVHATIEHDSVGLVQCYGVDTDALYAGTTTQAAGVMLRPSSFRALISVAPFYGSAAAGTDANINMSGIAGFAYVLAQNAVATTETAAVSVTAFIRAM